MHHFAIKLVFAPSRVRGLKQQPMVLGSLAVAVRTFTGAWIETAVRVGCKLELLRFAPSRVRGLKHQSLF